MDKGCFPRHQCLGTLPTFLVSYHFYVKQLPAPSSVCLRAFPKAEMGFSSQILQPGYAGELILLFPQVKPLTKVWWKGGWINTSAPSPPGWDNSQVCPACLLAASAGLSSGCSLWQLALQHSYDWLPSLPCLTSDSPIWIVSQINLYLNLPQGLLLMNPYLDKGS